MPSDRKWQEFVDLRLLCQLWPNLGERIVTAMTGIIVLAVIALAVVAALEPNHRRRTGLVAGLAGSSDVDDRDLARVRLDLLALAGREQTAGSESLSERRVILAVRHNSHRRWLQGNDAARLVPEARWGAGW